MFQGRYRHESSTDKKRKGNVLSRRIVLPVELSFSWTLSSSFLFGLHVKGDEEDNVKKEKLAGNIARATGMRFHQLSMPVSWLELYSTSVDHQLPSAMSLFSLSQIKN